MSTAHSIAAPQRRPAERATLRAIPTRARRVGDGGFAMVCIGILVVGLVALLGLNTLLAKGAFTLSALHKQSGALSDEANHLTQQLAETASSRNLATRAGELGMVRADSPGLIDPRTGRVTGVARAATTAGAPTVVTSPTQSTLPHALGVPAPAPAGPAPKPARAASAPAASGDAVVKKPAAQQAPRQQNEQQRQTPTTPQQNQIPQQNHSTTR